MVDSTTEDRLYPSGYRQIQIRSPRPKFSEKIRSKSARRSQWIDEKMKTMNFVRNFHLKLSENRDTIRSGKLIGKYRFDIDWPRSICCLKWTDGSFVVVQRNSHRILLFTSRFVFRSSLGNERGKERNQFDTPEDVKPLFLSSNSSNIVVSDSNNRRIQIFSIESNGNILFQSTINFQEKPIYLATNIDHFVVSFRNASLMIYSTYNYQLINEIRMKNLFQLKNENLSIPWRICLDENRPNLFVSNPLSRRTEIFQLTIDGKCLRRISLGKFSFFRLDSFVFDSTNEKFVVVDSINSIVYSIDTKNTENVYIEIEPTDSLLFPTDLSLTKEGHLIVVESSLTSEHQMKLFLYHSCLCHSYLNKTSTSNIKSSSTTSFRREHFQKNKEKFR